MTSPAPPLPAGRITPSSAADVALRKPPPGWLEARVPPAEPPRILSGSTGAARLWLVGYLSGRGGTAPTEDIIRDARAAGHADWAIYRARRPGIRSEPIRGANRRRWILVDAGAATPTSSTRIEDARTWLVGHLTDAGGRASSAEVREAASRAGYSVQTLGRARRLAEIRSVCVPGSLPRRTEWVLPQGQDDPTVVGDMTALEWLADFLACSGGRVDSAVVKQSALACGHHPRTMDRARRRAGIRSESVKGSFPRRTEWVLPDSST
jgi:hypothetical protein